MAADPHVREVGRLADEAERQVIVGICHGTVTLRTPGTRTDGAVMLDAARAEEFAQLFVSACWQAAAQCDEFAAAVPDGAGDLW